MSSHLMIRLIWKPSQLRSREHILKTFVTKNTLARTRMATPGVILKKAAQEIDERITLESGHKWGEN